MKPENAETIALKAVKFLAEDERKLGALCAQTGVSGTDLQAAVAEPDFLAGVLDFLLSNESWVVEFAEIEDLEPESVMRARASLPGGTFERST